MNLTNDELNLLWLYKLSTREETIGMIQAMMTGLSPEETELKGLAESVTHKLDQMTDAQFALLDDALDDVLTALLALDASNVRSTDE